MSEQEFPATPIKVIRQGGPVVNTAWVEKRGDGIVLVRADMRSKYCDAFCGLTSEGNGIVCMIGSEQSSKLMKGKESDWTEIEFAEFSCWKVEIAECARYTLTACLVKR